MRLAEFVLANQEGILKRFDSFARTQKPAMHKAGSEALRNHARKMLEAITCDMREPQSPRQAREKSRGKAPAVAGAPLTAAEMHGGELEEMGFDLNQTFAEFRALRAAVTLMWLLTRPQFGKDGVDDGAL